MGITKKMQMEEAENERLNQSCEGCNMSDYDAAHCDLRHERDCKLLGDEEVEDYEPDDDEIAIEQAERTMEEKAENGIDLTEYSFTDEELLDTLRVAATPRLAQSKLYKMLHPSNKLSDPDTAIVLIAEALGRIAKALDKIAERKEQ